MPNDDASYVELLLGDEIEDLFSENYNESSVDFLGYDLRLGERIVHVITGESINLDAEEETTVYPGETVIVKTHEILDLPDNVYAIGSPKMSLLLKGLWAHGGKTDFGFNSCLILGFQNVGSSPIELKRCMPIFHLSFYKIHNKTTNRWSGTRPDFPDSRLSPLDGEYFISKRELNKVKQIDGIKSYRLMEQLHHVNSKINFAYFLSMLALIGIFLAQLLPDFGIISELLANNLTLLSSIIGLISGVIYITNAILDWNRKRQQNE